jgi:hypothetical protein
MLTLEGFMAALGLIIAAFGLGYAIGCNSNKTQK